MKSRRYLAIGALLALLAASVLAGSCSGSGGHSAVLHNPSASPSPGGRATTMWVGNDLGENIPSFSATGTGNIAPTTNIVGSSTLLISPYVIAVDSTGQIWVPNFNVEFPDYVTAFASGANGNVAPVVDISGTNTGLNNEDTDAVTVDHNGVIYVSGAAGSLGAAISIFDSGSNGNTGPIALINGSNTTLGQAAGLGVLASGAIVVADFSNFAIDTFAVGSNGNVAPSSTISGSNTTLSSPLGLALDTSGNIYVGNSGGHSVLVFNAGSSGNIAPARSISGSNTLLQFPEGVAVDGAGYIYVSDAGANAVFVFAPGATGNVAPVQNISGSNTTLDSPRGIAVK
jgi:NHL repeat